MAEYPISGTLAAARRAAREAAWRAFPRQEPENWALRWNMGDAVVRFALARPDVSCRALGALDETELAAVTAAFDRVAAGELTLFRKAIGAWEVRKGKTARRAS